MIPTTFAPKSLCSPLLSSPVPIFLRSAFPSICSPAPMLPRPYILQTLSSACPVFHRNCYQFLWSTTMFTSPYIHSPDNLQTRSSPELFSISFVPQRYFPVSSVPFIPRIVLEHLCSPKMLSRSKRSSDIFTWSDSLSIPFPNLFPSPSQSLCSSGTLLSPFNTLMVLNMLRNPYAPQSLGSPAPYPGPSSCVSESPCPPVEGICLGPWDSRTLLGNTGIGKQRHWEHREQGTWGLRIIGTM